MKKTISCNHFELEPKFDELLSKIPEKFPASSKITERQGLENLIRNLSGDIKLAERLIRFLPRRCKNIIFNETLYSLPKEIQTRFWTNLKLLVNGKAVNDPILNALCGSKEKIELEENGKKITITPLKTSTNLFIEDPTSNTVHACSISHKKGDNFLTPIRCVRKTKKRFLGQDRFLNLGDYRPGSPLVPSNEKEVDILNTPTKKLPQLKSLDSKHLLNTLDTSAKQIQSAIDKCYDELENKFLSYVRYLDDDFIEEEIKLSFTKFTSVVSEEVLQDLIHHKKIDPCYLVFYESHKPIFDMLDNLKNEKYTLLDKAILLCFKTTGVNDMTDLSSKSDQQLLPALNLFKDNSSTLFEMFEQLNVKGVINSCLYSVAVGDAESFGLNFIQTLSHRLFILNKTQHHSIDMPQNRSVSQGPSISSNSSHMESPQLEPTTLRFTPFSPENALVANSPRVSGDEGRQLFDSKVVDASKKPIQTEMFNSLEEESLVYELNRYLKKPDLPQVADGRFLDFEKVNQMVTISKQPEILDAPTDAILPESVVSFEEVNLEDELGEYLDAPYLALVPDESLENGRSLNFEKACFEKDLDVFKSKFEKQSTLSLNLNSHRRILSSISSIIDSINTNSNFLKKHHSFISRNFKSDIYSQNVKLKGLLESCFESLNSYIFDISCEKLTKKIEYGSCRSTNIQVSLSQILLNERLKVTLVETKANKQINEILSILRHKLNFNTPQKFARDLKSNTSKFNGHYGTKRILRLKMNTPLQEVNGSLV